MIIDSQLEYSNAQAVTASAASTNIVDHGLGDAGVGEDVMHLLVQCTETATAAGAATVTFILQTDGDSAFGSATDVLSTAAIGKAALVAGARVAAFRLPAGMERYSRLYYTVGTGPLLTGKFDAVLVKDVPNGIAYARGYDI